MYGQMNEPPGARARVALTGLTVAEYFRDQEGQDVLLFIDNIFRFTQAGSEVSVLDCKMLTCPPTLSRQIIFVLACVIIQFTCSLFMLCHHMMYLLHLVASVPLLK